jgi:hypothetical protein
VTLVLGGLHLDRYGHLYSEPDTALRDRMDALYGTAQPTPGRHRGSAPSAARPWPQCGAKRSGERRERRRWWVDALTCEVGVEVRGI